jgi:hypothetical protein
MSLFKLMVLVLAIVAESHKRDDTPCGDLHALLLQSMQNTISLTALVEKQTGKINDVMNAMMEAKKEIWELREKLHESDRKFAKAKIDMEKAMQNSQKEVQELRKKLSSSKEKISKDIAVLNYRQGETTKASQQLTNRMESVEDIAGSWPEGKYCILASGSCPPNFKRHEAYLRAISTYGAGGSYIKSGTFGDSKIRCHGRCGQYPKWHGELYIYSCCK